MAPTRESLARIAYQANWPAHDQRIAADSVRRLLERRGSE
jgi:hypothetical protein